MDALRRIASDPNRCAQSENSAQRKRKEHGEPENALIAVPRFCAHAVSQKRLHVPIGGDHAFPVLRRRLNRVQVGRIRPRHLRDGRGLAAKLQGEHILQVGGRVGADEQHPLAECAARSAPAGHTKSPVRANAHTGLLIHFLWFRLWG